MMSGLAGAQGMFAGTASAASAVDPGANGPGGGNATEAAQVALLHKALDMERSLVNILA